MIVFVLLAAGIAAASGGVSSEAGSTAALEEKTGSQW
jgi:hypothetical protein